MSEIAASAAELMELERECCRRQAAKDFDWLLAVNAEDSLFFPPGSEIVRAKDIMEAAKERTTNSAPEKGGANFTWEPSKAIVSPSNEMAYVFGPTREKKEDGSVVLGKFLSIWVKDESGWKIVAEMRNEN